MGSIMHIGNQISMKEAAEPIADALVKVLGSIAANHIDREIAIEAIRVVGQTAGVNGVSVSHCNLINKTPPTDYGINVGEEEPD